MGTSDAGWLLHLSAVNGFRRGRDWPPSRHGFEGRDEAHRAEEIADEDIKRKVNRQVAYEKGNLSVLKSTRKLTQIGS